MRCLAMKRLLVFLAALAIVAPASALADPGDPVVLNSCGLTYQSTTNPASQIDGLAVQFTNNGPKTAQIVNIRADIAGQPEVIRDVGTFSPGIEIKHKYRAGQGQFALPAILNNILTGKPTVTCSIDSVVWDDGTKWVPIATATATLNASSNPSAITIAPASIYLNGTGTPNARLFYASGGGALSLNSNCGKVANVQILATTSHDLAVRIVPKGQGTCQLTVRDANDNFSTIPVSVTE